MFVCVATMSRPLTRSQLRSSARAVRLYNRPLAPTINKKQKRKPVIPLTIPQAATDEVKPRTPPAKPLAVDPFRHAEIIAHQQTDIPPHYLIHAFRMLNYKPNRSYIDKQHDHILATAFATCYMRAVKAGYTHQPNTPDRVARDLVQYMPPRIDPRMTAAEIEAGRLNRCVILIRTLNQTQQAQPPSASVVG